MNKIEEDILDFLNDIENTGEFVAKGTKDLMAIGLEIKGFGELALPITPLQAQNIIQIAQKAPFGKGSKTILDDKVRKAWEIDAKNISFKNKKWSQTLDDILGDVSKQLGLEHKNISASLYKLLIYEKGDFFTWHKDSEKEVNMFATLTITLPSQYEGGELAVRFQNQEMVIDMAKDAQNDKIAYSAFYADCDHEVRTLLKGYRVSLVYNLSQIIQETKYSASANQEKTNQLVELLHTWENQIDDESPLKIITLDHQYTPTNFSAEHLKLSDNSRFEILTQAAEKAGFFVKLGLLTHYMMGDIDYESIKTKSRGRGRKYRDYDDYDDDELADSLMGDDIFEEYTQIEHWANDGLPTLGELKMDTKKIITALKIGEGEPLEKQAEGYTGNAGMTMEYWYHYGAMVVWSKKHHQKVLANLGLKENLKWLNYYTNKVEIDFESKTYILKILANITIPNSKPLLESLKDVDVNGFAKTWILLEDNDKFLKNGDKLTQFFQFIDLKNWIELIRIYPVEAFSKIFQGLMQTQNMDAWAHWTELFTILRKDNSFKSFADEQINLFPQYLENLPKYLILDTKNNYFSAEAIANHNQRLQKILKCLLELNSYNIESEKWAEEISNHFFGQTERSYINDVIVAVLIKEKKYKGTALYQKIYAFCLDNLQQSVYNKPQPFPDWIRAIPTGKSYYSKEWDILKDFMNSPSLQTFDYRAVQRDRSSMEGAIKYTGKVDLDMETIKKGSPQTLRITKNSKSYDLALENWKIDVGFLENLKAIKEQK